MQLLGGLQRLLMSGEGLADGSGLLWAQVQGLLLALIEFPQVLLLLLVHHYVNPAKQY